MKSLSSYGYLAVFLTVSTELVSLGEANKNLPSPFKGFGYRLFTKHPAPGTNQKGEFNFVHLSLPHPQFPVFEPFPDILSPLFPSIKPPFPPVDTSRRPGSTAGGVGSGHGGGSGGRGTGTGSPSGQPGMGHSGMGTSTTGGRGTGIGSSSGQPGMGHSGMGTSKTGGAGSSSGHGSGQPAMGPSSSGSASPMGSGTGAGGSGSSVPGDGTGGTENDQGHDGSPSGSDEAVGGGDQHGESPMAEHGGSDGGVTGGEYEPEDDTNVKPTNEGDSGYDNTGSSDGGTNSGQPAPEDGMITGDEYPKDERTPSFMPGTNGPTGGGTNGPSGGAAEGPGGPGVQIDPNAPICLYKNYSGLNLCTNDPDYPSVELKAYIQARYSQFVTMYADIAELNTQNSVDGLGSPHQETYICQTKVKYWKPLRARNSQGLWKIIVNVEQFTQTVRIETCSTLGRPCSMVPPCFPTSCVQKHVYHRMLTFDPWNHYYPFKIDLFRIPASCSCLIKSPRYDP